MVAPHIRVLLEAVHKTVNQVNQVIESEQPIDLNTLEERVRTLCNALQKLPPEHVQPLEAQIASIIAKFNEWSSTLQTRQEKVKKELQDLGKQKLAHERYINHQSNSSSQSGNQEGS